MIAKRRKQALLGAKCVQVHNASKRPHSDPVATEDDRAWSVYTFETKYVRSKIVSCIHHLLGSNVCKVSLRITRHCSLLLVTRARYRYSLCAFSTYFVMSRFLLRYLGRIQDLTKGGLDKRPPKAVASRGVRGPTPPENF